MPMPGAFDRDEPEVELPVTESEGGDYAETSEGGAQTLLHAMRLDLTIYTDEEMTIDELEAEFQGIIDDGDDLEDEEDSDYSDEFEDGESVEIDFEEDYDSDGNFVGDPALAEAERLANAAEVANEETAQASTETASREGGPRYSFAIDRMCKLVALSLSALTDFLAQPPQIAYSMSTATEAAPRLQKL